MKKRKLAFVTGSRADYGIMRRYLKLLDQDKDIDLEILVTGALLDETYGHQVDLIYEDGFFVSTEVPIDINAESNKNILHSMAVAMDKFGVVFADKRLDLLIILGDRYEMLSVAVAAAMQRIPILHIHGGEATYGNYDEFIRHSITKMSLYHFTATEEYKKRVIQLGEEAGRVYNLGALGAENCMFIEEKNIPEDVMNLQSKKYFVVLFHPETLTNANALEQIQELLSAIMKFEDYEFVFLGTNADTNANSIRDAVKKYVNLNKNTKYYENLHTDAYHYLLKHAICLIGNSSSGIIEAPSLGIYTINIGNRQKGRVRGNSVIDIDCNMEEIKSAIDKVLKVYDDIQPVNPYYQKNTAERYYETTKKILINIDNDIKEPKQFMDFKLYENES